MATRSLTSVKPTRLVVKNATGRDEMDTREKLLTTMRGKRVSSGRLDVSGRPRFRARGLLRWRWRPRSVSRAQQHSVDSRVMS